MKSAILTLGLVLFVAESFAATNDYTITILTPEPMAAIYRIERQASTSVVGKSIAAIYGPVSEVRITLLAVNKTGIESDVNKVEQTIRERIDNARCVGRDSEVSWSKAPWLDGHLLLKDDQILPIQVLLSGIVVGDLLFSEETKPGSSAKTAWQLVWSDEFDHAKLDYTKWAVEENAHGGGNAEQQFYVDRPENVRVENGNLVIEARKENSEALGQKRNYTSGRIRTKHRADWTYCRAEVRAKLPTGRSLWPAIWMMPSQERYGGWAASGEIDIMELIGHEPNTVLGTLHYGSKWPKNVHTGKQFVLAKGSFADDFHVFALEWEQGVMRWYVDGALYQTQTQWRSDGGPFPAPFDQPFHLILNVSVGGHLPGPPDANTVFPQRMLVDYIRVYQRKR